MSEQDVGKQPPSQGVKPTGTQAGGSQSGGTQRDVDHDPKHDPAAAGADAYNSGNKTGNPVRSGMPGTGENGPGVNSEKPVPMRDKG